MEKQMEKKTAEKEEKKQIKQSLKERVESFPQHKVLLIVLDIIFINLSSFLALWLRFNMKISDIELWYVDSIVSAALVNTVGTVLIFAVLKLYSSLWRFASIKELVYVIEGCLLYTSLL